MQNPYPVFVFRIWKDNPKFKRKRKKEKNIRRSKEFWSIRFCERHCIFLFKKTKKASNAGGGFLFASTAAATCFRSLSTSRGISTHPNRTSWPATSLNIADRSLPPPTVSPPLFRRLELPLTVSTPRDRKEEKAFPPRMRGILEIAAEK